MSGFWRDRRHYLFVVGRVLHSDSALKPESRDANKVQNVQEGWTEADYRLWLEEGRRKLDIQAAQLEATRGRAQVTFTTTLVAIGATATFWQPLTSGHRGWGWWLLAGAAMLVLLLALAGSFAAFSLPVVVANLHPAEVSTWQSPVLEKVARDYAKNVPSWTSANAVMLDTTREASRYLALGAMIVSLLWAFLGH